MKILKNIVIVLIVLLFCYLPNKHFSSGEIVVPSSHSGLNKEQSPNPICLFINHSSLQLAFLENNFRTTTNVFQQVLKIYSFYFFGSVQENKKSIFYTTIGYFSLVGYICTLKKSDFIYPSHTFL